MFLKKIGMFIWSDLSKKILSKTVGSSTSLSRNTFGFKFTRCGRAVQAKTGWAGSEKKNTKGKERVLCIYIYIPYPTSTNHHYIELSSIFVQKSKAFGPSTATKHSKWKANKKHIRFETNHHTPSDLSILQYGIPWDSNQKFHPIIHPTWAYPTTNAILHWKKGRGLRAGEGTPMGWEICLWTCVDPAVHQPMSL